MSIIDAKNSLDRELKSIPEIHGIGIMENKIVVYLNSLCDINIPKIYKGYHVIKEKIGPVNRKLGGTIFTELTDDIEFESDVLPTKVISDRGCCDECGEGYDNEPEWRYNTECAVCGEPIPKDKIIKK
jgi:hypothetical protein